MSIVKPSCYIKGGVLLLLLYITILNLAQYSFYYKQFFCPKDGVIIEKNEYLTELHRNDAASIIQEACLNKLTVYPILPDSNPQSSSIAPNTTLNKGSSSSIYKLLTNLWIF